MVPETVVVAAGVSRSMVLPRGVSEAVIAAVNAVICARS